MWGTRTHAHTHTHTLSLSLSLSHNSFIFLYLFLFCVVFIRFLFLSLFLLIRPVCRDLYTTYACMLIVRSQVPLRQPEDGQYRPKHVAVHYTAIKYTSCDTVVFDYIKFSKLFHVILQLISSPPISGHVYRKLLM